MRIVRRECASVLWCEQINGSFATAEALLLTKIETGETTNNGINMNGEIVGVLFDTLGIAHGFLRQ